MSKSQTLRGLINQRLSLAAEEIFELFERTIAEYEEQLCRSKEENERQRKSLNPGVRSHSADVQVLLVKTENVPTEQQETGPSLDQEDPPEPAHIKEEEEEVWWRQETEQLHGLKEEEEEEEAESSQLDEKQTEEMLDCESETDDSSDYLEESAKPQSALNHVSHMESNSVETAVSVSERATSSGPKEPEPEATKIQKEEKPFSCSVCGKSFRRKSHLFRHEKTHKEDVQHVSGLNLLQKEETPVSEKDSGINPESSSECASSSDQKEELPKKERPFCCSLCGKAYSLKGNLKLHMGHYHSGEKPHTCPVCGKTFVQKFNLKRHMICHPGEKPHSCSVCGESFRERQSLKIHSFTHTGKKSFTCSLCGAGFSCRRGLKRHTAVHTGEKPYSCNICDRRFARSDKFKNHSCNAKSRKNK